MLKISRNTLELWLKTEQETGDCRALTNYQPGKALKIQDTQAFGQFVRQPKRKTQQQLAELWGDKLSQQNLSDALKKLGREKADAFPAELDSGGNAHQAKTDRAQQRDQELRREFLGQLASIAAKHLVYEDEAGFDKRDDYADAYTPNGERCDHFKSGKRREKTSWIAALKQGKVFAPLTIEGCCNRHLVEAWLANSLLPQLTRGELIVIDNATFDKRQTIAQLVEEAGSHLWDLPRYSPERHQIERWWSVLKTWLKQRLTDFDTLGESVEAAFKHSPNVFA